MATSSEDALGELYAWDSTIDEMYDRGVDHADFDEDEALEAYEEMIQVGAAPIETAHGDAVLSLAAQLLTKHFSKFPHVHLNVVDVLLDLSSGNRPQAVRIHSVRSLLQIVKSSASGTPLPSLRALCRDRVAPGVKLLVATETGATQTVVVRLLSQLQDALEAVEREPKTDDKREKRVEKEKEDKASSDKETEEAHRRNDERRREEAAKRERREARFRGVSDEVVETTQPQKAGHNGGDHSNRPEPPRRERSQEDRERDRGHDRDRDHEHERRQPERANAPPSRDEPTRGRRGNTGGKENPNGCPPSSFIFVGGVPRNTYHDDIINYLSCIDESVTFSCVQIKFPNSNPNANGYAFVSLESVEHARQAIRHIKTTEFNGRTLVGDFARGPPCATLQFVERNASCGMHDVNAVNRVDAETLGQRIWDELCDALKPYGSMDVLPEGRIRFRDAESAKSVIRKHRFMIDNREFLPVYEPEEQAEIDSSQRRRRSENEDRNRARRGGGGGGGGDLNRYGGAETNGRRGGRDDGDRKRHRSRSLDRDHKDKQPRREHRDANGDRDRQHHGMHREFDQSRYGPRDPPSASKRRENEFSPHRDRSTSRARESNVNHRGREPERRPSQRVSSRSPIRPDSEEKRMSISSRRSTSDHRGRSRSRSSTKRLTSDIQEPRRSRSPAKSTTSSKHGRGEFRDHGRRRDSSVDRRDESPRTYRDRNDLKHAQDVRGSRSPPKRKEPLEDRRLNESDNRTYDGRAPRGGRSPSPRRLSPSEHAGNSGPRRGGDNHRNDRPRRDDDSRRRGSDDHMDGGGRREDPRPPRFDRDQHGRRDGNGRPQMSKYGTVAGRPRSPSPPRFRRDEPNTNGQSHGRGGGDREEGERGRPSFGEGNSQRYGNENRSRENHGRRASPPRHQLEDRSGDKRSGSLRGRSPSPKHSAIREESGHSDRRRSRSPSPFSPNAHKKQRSGSPRQRGEASQQRNQRLARFDADDLRRYGDQAHRVGRANGADGRNRNESKYKEDRGREDRRSRDDDHEKMRPPSPRKDAKRNTEERRPRSPSPQSPRDQHVRTPSPGLFDKTRQQQESPRPAAKVSKGGASSSTYEEIDECMVDYEEDDE